MEKIDSSRSKVLRNTKRIKIQNETQSSILTISNASLKDSGKYKCLVKGKATEESITFTVEVGDRPADNKYVKNEQRRKKNRRLRTKDKLGVSLLSLKDICTNTKCQMSLSTSTPADLNSYETVDNGCARCGGKLTKNNKSRSGSLSSLKCYILKKLKWSQSVPANLDSAPLLEELPTELSRYHSEQTMTELVITNEIEKTGRLIKIEDLKQFEKRLLENCLMKTFKGKCLWELMRYIFIDEKKFYASQNDLYFVKHPNQKHITQDMFDALEKTRPRFTVGEFCDSALKLDRRDVHQILLKYSEHEPFKKIGHRDRLELQVLCSKHDWKLLAEDLDLDSTQISHISNRIPNYSSIESSVVEMFKFLSIRCPTLTLLDMLIALKDINAVEAFYKLVDVIKVRQKMRKAEGKASTSCISIEVYKEKSKYGVKYFGLETSI